MWTDKELLLSNAQAITGDADSTNCVDMKALKDIGIGEPVHVYARIAAAFDALTTLDISIRGVDDNARANPVTLLTKNVALAALTLNATIPLGSIPAGVATKDFLDANYNVNGANPTVGKITLGFVTGSDAKPGNVAKF